MEVVECACYFLTRPAATAAAVVRLDDRPLSLEFRSQTDRRRRKVGRQLLCQLTLLYVCPDGSYGDRARSLTASIPEARLLVQWNGANNPTGIVSRGASLEDRSGSSRHSRANRAEPVDPNGTVRVRTRGEVGGGGGGVIMWSSRNRMLNDTDGDDVAFLSGSGTDNS